MPLEVVVGRSALGVAGVAHVADDRAAQYLTEFASGMRAKWTVSSVLMNTNRSMGTSELMPFAESAGTRTRDSGEGRSPSTRATRIRIHAADGPGSKNAPWANRHSIAVK